MAIQLKRATTAMRTSFVAQSGEPIWDKEKKQLFVGDGVATGGILVDGGVKRILSADVTNTTATLSVASGLNIPIRAGQIWLVRGVLKMGSTNGSPISVQIGGPGGVTGTTTYTNISLGDGNDVSLGSSFSLSQGTFSTHSHAIYTIVDNSAGFNDGNITISFAQASAGAHTVSIKKWSHVEAVLMN